MGSFPSVFFVEISIFLMLKKVPHTYVIVFFVVLIAAAATWFVPGGRYEPVVNPDGSTQLQYVQLPSNPQSWQVFTAFIAGFEKASSIIAFILVIGGAFWIVNSTKAIDTGISSFLKSVSGLSRYRIINFIGIHNIIITAVMVLFSVFGAVFGMSEETIAFIVIIVPLAVSMGYDSIVGVCMVFVAAGVGFAGAVLNPFTIGIAQELSGLPMFSGIGYRLVCWVIITAVGVGYTLWYAGRIRNNPERSPVFEEDSYWRERSVSGDGTAVAVTPKAAWIVWAIISLVFAVYSFYYPLSTLSFGSYSVDKLPLLPVVAASFSLCGFITLRKSLYLFILNLLGFTIAVLIVGVTGYQWYIEEIAGLFLALGIAAGISSGLDAGGVARQFIEGAKDILSAALIVGLAGGIIVILENGNIIHSILHSMATAMSELGKVASIGVMYLIQTGINIFLPSGSAKAALTMPIMAPFSDLIGISRQATVMAFQFGDGFTNMITPTSGVLIGVLGMARIPYSKWVRWIAPLMAILIVLGFLLLIPTVLIELNGF
jgi:uncharacterized ion transporter superfamily protein YfcC